MITMKMTGVKEARRALAGARVDLVRILSAALVAGAFIISNDAKDRCRYKTGNAQRSIHIGYEGANVTGVQPTDGAAQPVTPGIVALISSDLERNLQVELFVGTDVWYTWNLEFINGFPFLRPALDNNRVEVNAEVRRALQSALRKKGF